MSSISDPQTPKNIDDEWFFRTKSWYDRKEQGLVEGQPVSFHYWAIDNGRFIGEFQLRTEFSEKVMLDIGSIGWYLGRYHRSLQRCGGASFAETILDNHLIAKSNFSEELI